MSKKFIHTLCFFVKIIYNICKMKKVVLILPCCLLIMCTAPKDNSTDVNEKEKLINKGCFEKAVSALNIDFNDTTGSFTNFSIDEKLALEIGTAVLKKIYGEVLISNTSYIVREISEGGFFVVIRMPNNNIPGADYNVAINKKDGKILKIWMGE